MSDEPNEGVICSVCHGKGRVCLKCGWPTNLCPCLHEVRDGLLPHVGACSVCGGTGKE